MPIIFTSAMDPYAFPSKLAQDTLNASKNGLFCYQNPGIGINYEQQATWVREALVALYEERNPAGQTLLYCLLRFTMDPYIRNKFLYAATPEQLALQNTNCGSTAMLGYFWGEFENPRMEGITPVSDIFSILKMPINAATIANGRGETALDFAKSIASRKNSDYQKLKTLLG
jgi:hypothetical protein